MKAFYIWITLLAALGIGISFYLIPSKEDQALIQLKSKQFTEAETYYQEQYDKGVRTPDIIMALSRLHEKLGNLKAAISVMREYVRLHPNDVFGLRTLADLYHDNQQYKEYHQILLQIEKQKTDSDLLQELAEWYQNENAKEPLFTVVKEYIATGKADESYYLELALLYAAKKDYKNAAATLDARRTLFPKAVGINEILFEIWMDIEISKTEGNAQFKTKAVDLLASYLLKKNDPKLTYYALGVINTRYPELATSFIAQLKPLIEKDIASQILVLQILWENPAEKKRVLPQLLELIKTAQSNIQLQNFAFNVLLDNGNDSLLIDFIQKIPAKNIEDREIISLSITALTHQNPILAEEMQRALGPAFLRDHPVIAVSLAIGAQEKNAREQLDNLMQKTTLSHPESYFLLKLAAAAKFEAEALKLGANLPPYLGFEDYELVDIALAYMQIDHAEELYKLMMESIPAIGKNRLASALAILDISRGRSKKVAEWLSKEKTVKEYLLSGLYTAAEESKEYPLALYIAKRRLQEYPAAAAEADYALALVQVGKIDSGIAILKKLYAKEPNDRLIETVYFNALAQAAKTDPLYNDALAAFMSDLEKRERISPELRRNFAYVYLENLHDYPMAERSFQILSENASPENSDLQTLVYLWGPTPSDKNIEWLEKRAFQSNSHELGYWLEHLLFIERYDTVIDLFQSRSAEDLELNAYFAYMEALAYEKRKEELRKAICLALDYVHDRKQLEKLSLYAEEAEYPEARRMIWERIAYEWPDDPIAWQNLATAAFNQHDYRGAREALYNFFSLYSTSDVVNSKLYESFYEYGEIFKKYENYRKARRYFKLALCHIEKITEQTPRMIELKALILHKLGETSKAQGIMHQLYWMTGEDPDLAASYANMMMDDGDLMRTSAFFFRMGRMD